MAKPSTRQGLIDYCLRRLGAPVLEINVDDDQIDDLVDDALQYFQERHFDGVERMYLKYRFTEEDLNRMWTPENIDKLHTGQLHDEELHPELIEMREIDLLLEDFINGLDDQDRYFIDLHTTSSPSVPFAAVDDQPESYDFAMKLPIPFISNLDEFLEGTLLHYLDHIDFKAIVFEAGMHDDPRSVLKHEALIFFEYN